MTKTLTLEGDLASVDTKTIISTQGSVTAPSVVTPAGTKKIVRIFATCSADGAAAGSAVFFARLGGNAVLNGEQTIMVSAAGIVAVQAGSDQAPERPVTFIWDDCDLDISPADTIEISGEMAGTDLGTAGLAVTLVFE